MEEARLAETVLFLKPQVRCLLQRRPVRNPEVQTDRLLLVLCVNDCKMT